MFSMSVNVSLVLTLAIVVVMVVVSFVVLATDVDDVGALVAAGDI